ncbi:MAG: complex I subunit 5 family protein [Candidatus Omnitrophota bacterium]
MSCCLSLLRFDTLSVFVGVFIALFSVLVIIYSAGFMRKRNDRVEYNQYIILTAVISLITVFANNLLVFVVSWGFLGLLLYLLIGFGKGTRVSSTAKKTFIIVGGTDALMLLGLIIVWKLAGTLEMSKISVLLDRKIAVAAYLCLLSGAFAKAGAMPFHTWVPDTAEDAPTPVAAFLPASLDKLIGIYFLVRLSLEMFVMNQAMNTLLMALGSVTIIAAVMMALVQHDLKRLLGYHAVSQVGYMVLGIGTGNPIGIAGGLFHMLNNAIYKSCLFFCGGVVEEKTGTTDLEKLGGFAKILPVTFVSFLIASLAISGVPPLNGFVSKWMVYQGIINTAKNGGLLWILWLIAAIFGSALTLASFMKLVHAVFLGQPSNYKQAGNNRQQETYPEMLAPPLLLALFCVVFGVFAYQVPLSMLIFPSLGINVPFLGIWNSSLATLLLIVGIVVGAVIYYLGTAAKTREAEVFVGGEDVQEHPEMRVSGTEFYNTIKETAPLKTIYCLAENKVFDIYHIGEKAASGFAQILRNIHNGILPSYLSWCLLGMMVLFYILFSFH